MKKLLISTILLIFALTVNAVPARRVWKTVKQSDGTQVRLMLVGDENFHCFRTTDGLPVMEEQGSYYYAKVVNDRLERTEMLAHDVEQRTVQEHDFAATLCTEQQLSDAARKAPRVTQPRMPRHVGEATGDFTGSKKGLIILVQFKDQPFSIDNPKETYEEIANKEGYRNNSGAVGSVHDYFFKQSNGLFDLTFDVAGPYTTPNALSYYGQNSYGNDNPTRVRELIRFAITAANDDVYYPDYDWDGDGEVDQVFILYAGYAESSGAPSYTIWPHESKLYSYAMFFDGVTINTYACSEELDGDGSDAADPGYVPQMSGLGTICHEFSHCLGLPDFYDTASNSIGSSGGQYGMGFWDLMDSGCYNYNGWAPSNYSGYERKFCGWSEYRELTDPCKVTGQKSVDAGGETYVIYNPGNHNEYYLLENRYKTGWDKGLEGSGLLIYHVNYIADRWYTNSVNTSGAGNPCMNPVPADNDLSIYIYNDQGQAIGYGDVGDAWPTTIIQPDNKKVINNTLSDTSTPACTLYTPNTDGTYLLHSKIKVNRRGGVIDFVYNDGTSPWGEATGIEDIAAAETTDITGQAVTIYNVNGMEVMRTDKYTGKEPLSPGLYIIRTKQGQSQKVLIPAN